MIFSVHVEVRLRPGIADPQGSTIERALPPLGFDGVREVRVGKSIRFAIEAADEAVGPRRGRGHVPPVPHQPGDRGRGRRARGRGRGRVVSRRVGVVLFPGSNCEQDVLEAVALARRRAPRCCGTATPTTNGVDAVVVPGGFAHGDYLRPGAIARFSPVMGAVADLRRRRRPGRRHLQRLPGAHRGRPPAGCAAEERGPQVPVRHGVAAGRVHRLRRSPARPRPARCCASRSTTSRATTPATTRPSPGSGPTTASCCATSTTPTARSTTSPASATRAATWWGSCRTPSGPAATCSARPTACRCCARSLDRRRPPSTWPTR